MIDYYCALHHPAVVYYYYYYYISVPITLMFYIRFILNQTLLTLVRFM